MLEKFEIKESVIEGRLQREEERKKEGARERDRKNTASGAPFKYTHFISLTGRNILSSIRGEVYTQE